MISFRTDGPASTQALGAAIADLLRPGDVVALAGDLGAGKTCFVQGLARGLGIAAPVTSPTFVLVKHYRGRLDLVHLDVYRLDRLGDVRELGDDVFDEDVVTVVEWGDAIRSILPDDRIDLELVIEDDTTRVVVCTPHGRATDRAPDLRGLTPPADQPATFVVADGN